MFVYLSKLLPVFIYPLGISIILFLASLIIAKFSKHEHKHRFSQVLLLVGLVVLGLASNRWLSYSLARSLEWRYLPPEVIPSAEVIVLLGGGTEPGDYPRQMAEVNAAGDRVLYAAYLYQQGAAPLILVSGGNVEFSSGRTSTPAEDMTELLMLIGVPPTAILQQPKSQNTYEDALFSVQLLADLKVTEVILVTSAMHMPRSKALFENQGVTVIPAPADFTITQTHWQSLFTPTLGEAFINLLPNAGALNLTTNVIKEYIGMLIYSLRGWM